MSVDVMPLSVRDGLLADLPALLALEAGFPGDRLSARQFRRHLTSRSATLRVIGSGAAIAGYALVFRRRGSAVARLYSIAIDPSWRGQGIGQRLLADIEAVARSGGARTLRLEVRTDNAPAIALYRARGFTMFGRYANYYEDGADALRFEKDLAASGSAFGHG